MTNTLGFSTSVIPEVAVLRLHGIEPHEFIPHKNYIIFRYLPDPNIDRVLDEYRAGPIKEFDDEVQRVVRLVRSLKAAQQPAQPIRAQQ
jgi:hypothetical protein